MFFPSKMFRFSGITEESMIGIKTTLREVQAVLLSIIHEDTVLLGHSLESDLKSLKVWKRVDNFMYLFVCAYI